MFGMSPSIRPPTTRSHHVMSISVEGLFENIQGQYGPGPSFFRSLASVEVPRNMYIFSDGSRVEVSRIFNSNFTF